MRKAVVLVSILLLAFSAGAGVIIYFSIESSGRLSAGPGLRQFKSREQFLRAFRNGAESGYRAAEDGMMRTLTSPAAAGTAEEQAPAHSDTNVQVEGVDEADVVKNDGKYIYAIGGNTVYIIAAYPAENARLLSRIESDEQGKLHEIFVNGDRLMVIGSSYSDSSPEPLGEGSTVPRGEATFIKVYDVTNRERPALLRTVSYEGSYATSRMIGPNVHVVLTTHPYYALYDRKDLRPEDIIPGFSDTPGAREASYSPACEYNQVQAVDPDGFTSFLSVVSLSLNSGAGSLNKRVIAGYSDNVYASLENLYVSSAEYVDYGDLRTLVAPQANTRVHKFAFRGAGTRYVTSAEVPGTILNQFSMDESGGFFRIATTRGHVSREGSDSTNNVYILGPDMKIAGRLEGLAPGERIYSVRFMGARAYMVTFKKVDPLFVLDLADPGNPRVLGELKIPGYSDYLHPYDETHIIGVGKNTVEAAPEEGGNFAWYQGIKLAIFDVTDVANPREMHQVEIGDRGTDSYALYDHKAFLFDREKNLLVLPVLLAELSSEQKASPGRRANDYGSYTFQGAYVYDVSLDGGFRLKGRVTHAVAGEQPEYGYGYYGAPDSVRRALYIGDNLYTISEARVKINALGDLSEIKTVELR